MEVLGCKGRGEEREKGDALGRGLQVGEMCESSERPDGALNMKGGERGLPERRGGSCKAGSG